MKTREALFTIQVLFQRYRDVSGDIYICFIDYHKALDRVRHEKMIEILYATGMATKDLRIITNLYWNQKANIIVEDTGSEDIKYKRGVLIIHLISLIGKDVTCLQYYFIYILNTFCEELWKIRVAEYL